MKRQILGILATTLTAPYLGAIYVLIPIAARTEFASLVPLKDIQGLLALFIAVGMMGLAEFGAYILLAASVMALILAGLRIRSPALSIGLGAAIGLCLGIYIDLPHNELPVPALLGIGALCGWIYWRIAIRQTPDRPRLILNP